MTHFIMEVSSQAYKTNRVYKLFLMSAFLNITPTISVQLNIQPLTITFIANVN